MVTLLDDAELLRRYAREGDDAALAELVQRHIGLVCHAAQRMIGLGGSRGGRHWRTTKSGVREREKKAKRRSASSWASPGIGG